MSGGIDDASEPLKARILQLESDLAHQLQEHLRRVDDVRALRARLAAAEEEARRDREAFGAKMAAERAYSETLKARLAAAEEDSRRLTWLEANSTAYGSAIEMEHDVWLSTESGLSLRERIDEARANLRGEAAP
jgi:hypothetical protein